MSDKIVKLVFLRSGESRKAVVPLVEGCDFEQFLQRVRRRLGVPEDIKPTLSDAATGTVDSIDRLLEVDEGNTLDVHLHTAGGLPYVPPPAAALPTPPPPQPPGNGAAGKAVCAGAHGASSAHARQTRSSIGAIDTPGYPGSPFPSQQPGTGGEFRVEVGDGEDDGESKYHRRRPRGIISLARSRRAVVCLGLLAGLGLIAYYADLEALLTG